MRRGRVTLFAPRWDLGHCNYGDAARLGRDLLRRMAEVGLKDRPEIALEVRLLEQALDDVERHW